MNDTTKPAAMPEIAVSRYAKPENVGGWLGVIEPKDKSWIIFIDANGRPVLFPHRDKNGGCIGPPCVIPDRDAALEAERVAEETEPA